MTEEDIKGIYKHYKGDFYAVLGVARDSTNGAVEGRLMVIYYSLVGKDRLHVRDLGEFLSFVDGVPRFTRV